MNSPITNELRKECDKVVEEVTTKRPCIRCKNAIQDTTTYITRDKKLTWSNSWCCESCHRCWKYYGKQEPYST